MQQFKIIYPKIVQKIEKKLSYSIRYKTLWAGKPGLRKSVYVAVMEKKTGMDIQNVQYIILKATC
jgi:hypothetical protein